MLEDLVLVHLVEELALKIAVATQLIVAVLPVALIRV